MSERTNIFDIAREAGVSIATVSRVIGGAEGVKKETREKVMAVVEKYGYRPNLMAAGLSQKRSHTLGVVLPLIENPFYSKMCLALQLEADRLNYSILLFQIARGTMIQQDFVDALIGRRLEGVIFSGDMMDDASAAGATRQMLKLKRQMPLVVINPREPVEDLPSLTTDLDGCTVTALRHLRLLGHEKIALLGGAGNASMAGTRENAYMREMEAAGGEPYPLTMGEDPLEGELCAGKLLASLNGRAHPTAIFCFNDLVALGAMRQFRRMGIRVPEDLALVGCDNQFFSPYTEPPLTTLDLHIEEIGRLAMNLLVSGQGGESGLFKQSFDPTLIVRESCGCRLTRPSPRA